MSLRHAVRMSKPDCGHWKQPSECLRWWEFLIEVVAMTNLLFLLSLRLITRLIVRIKRKKGTIFDHMATVAVWRVLEINSLKEMKLDKDKARLKIKRGQC